MINLKSIFEKYSVSIGKVSELSGIGANRLKLLVEGEEPTLEEINQIAKALGISLDDFLPPKEDHLELEIMFRSNLRDSTSFANKSINSLSKKVGNIFELLISDDERYFWPDLFSIKKGKYLDAESYAEIFRDYFVGGDQVGPLFDLPQIVSDDLGVLMLVINNPDIEGASVFFKNKFFVFISSRYRPRMLFTLAHELGHIFSHFLTIQKSRFADLDFFEDVGLEKKTENNERFANEFASSLLLPKHGLGIALKTIREMMHKKDDSISDVEILYLSRIYGVSFLATALRLERLGLLPKGGAYSIYDFINNEYGSPEKRAESLNLPPRPEVDFPLISPRILRSAITKIKNGDVSLGRAISILDLSISDILSENVEKIN